MSLAPTTTTTTALNSFKIKVQPHRGSSEERVPNVENDERAAGEAFHCSIPAAAVGWLVGWLVGGGEGRGGALSALLVSD